MDINVPAAFVAYDSKEKQSGALIEWFIHDSISSSALSPLARYLLKIPLQSASAYFEFEFYMPGGDYCEEVIADFDRKKGTHHNFKTIRKLFKEFSRSPDFNTDWKKYWSKTFVFDALIGNTDRHQDNWGIILTSTYNPNSKEPTIARKRATPVFGNGTSMGHEIFPDKFEKFNFKKYILNGHHHMKWKLAESSNKQGVQHAEMLKKIVNKYPETHAIMVNCLKKVNTQSFKTILDDLVSFDIPVRLTVERANFMLELLHQRHQYLLDELRT